MSLLSSGWHKFWPEVCCHLCISSCVMCLLSFLLRLKIFFSLSLVFQQLDYAVPWYGFVYFIWGFLASWFVVFIKVGHFSVFTSSNTASILSFPLEPQIQISQSSYFVSLATKAVTLFSLHSLCWVLDSFYCCILKFTDLFFYSANLLLIYLIFHFRYCIYYL